MQTAQAVTSPDCGAVATFVGLVRDHNQRAPGPLARLRVLRAAGGEVVRADRAEAAVDGRARAWRSTIASGRSQIGEASVVIAAASPHRADAFAACRYAIERIKQIAPIWKHEHFEGGESGSKAPPRIRTTRRRGGSRSSARGSDRSRDSARHDPAVRAAARDGRRPASWHARSRDRPTRRPPGTRWRRSSRRSSDYRPVISCAVNEEYAKFDDAARRMATRSLFCRRCRGRLGLGIGARSSGSRDPDSDGTRDSGSAIRD